MACIDKLMAMNVKAILIACNTATAASVTKVRQLMNQYSMPIISIEPAIKPACALPGTGKVFMMATLATTPSQQVSRTSGTHAGSEPGDQHTMPRHS